MERRTVGKGMTLQEFCHAVWQNVETHLRIEGHEDLLEEVMTRTHALHYAMRLWEGNHPKPRSRCHNIPKATAIVVDDILKEVASHKIAIG